jgi:hypothetical protein
MMIRQNDQQSSLLTPEERRTAIARILAAGVLRLQARPALGIAPQPSRDAQDSEQTERESP